jgi:ATP-binding cassette subfamily B (MDR/TAP) protein 9
MEPDAETSHIKAGDLVSFMFYQQSLSRTFSSIGNILTGISGALGAADKVFQIINRQPKIAPPGSLQMGAPGRDNEGNSDNNNHSAISVAHPQGTFEGSITLENVSFTYPARPGVVVLKDFNLHVPAGKVVALVGPSGGGKSSTIRLIQHYYEPSCGRVLISGKPVEEFDPVWLRRQVAIVGQEPTLFGRSIRRNIIYGLEGTEDEPSEAAIIEAAKLSNAHDFVMNMPKGYDTEVSTGYERCSFAYVPMYLCIYKSTCMYLSTNTSKSLFNHHQPIRVSISPP